MSLAPLREHLPRMTDRLALGKGGLQVSPFCLGLTASPDAVSAAYDHGVNFFFFSADMHWPLYESTRRGLETLLQRGGGIRDRIIVGVVSYCTQPEFCIAPFQEALAAVPGLERIDLAIAGGAYSHEILMRLPILHQHRTGRFLGIRAIGCTFHDRAGARLMTGRDLLDIVYIRYNTVHPGARVDLFGHLTEKRSDLLFNFKNTIGFIPPSRYARLGLGEDHWRPKFTDHYRFILSRPEFDGILCAMGTPDHVEQLARALEEGPLDEEEEQYMLDLALLDQGKAELGPGGSPSGGPAGHPGGAPLVD